MKIAPILFVLFVLSHFECQEWFQNGILHEYGADVIKQYLLLEKRFGDTFVDSATV